MQYKRYGGIDIGSNAVRLIIKDVLPGVTYADAIMNKRVYVRLPLRLGGDVFQYNKIKKQKQKDFIKAIKIYNNLLDFYNVKNFRACATSAVRSAENGIEIIKKIKNTTGINIDIINGEEESSLIFETNRYNLPDKRTYLSADLGGGSLQLTIFKNDKLIWTHSYKIGTVRMLNNKVSDKEMNKFKNKLQEIELQFPNLQLLGTGGNINALSKIYGNKKVSHEGLKNISAELKHLSLEERMRKFKLKNDRADVIIPALKVYLLLMQITKQNEIYVPKTGLADGIIRQLYEKDFGKQALI
jgi:exopolyphosphatase/guanosine-5'-triphosphate,3'-diphosphate pyrophosphatase